MCAALYLHCQGPVLTIDEHHCSQFPQSLLSCKLLLSRYFLCCALATNTCMKQYTGTENTSWHRNAQLHGLEKVWKFPHLLSDEVLGKGSSGCTLIVFHTLNVLGPDRNLFLSQVIIHFTDGVDEQIDQLEAAASTLHSEGNFFCSPR